MKILVTIGTHEPFDRLIRAMDEIASFYSDSDVIFEAQTSTAEYVPINMKTYEFISPLEFEKKFHEADFVVSHAGMGTIISALTSNKLIIVFPRSAKLGETRNEHQLATVKAFGKLKYIYVADHTSQLRNMIDDAINGKLKPLHHIGKHGSLNLINSIKVFIQG